MATSNSRKWWFFGLFALLFAVLLVRLFFLQIRDWQRYADMAKKNRVRIVPIQAPRGLIFSKTGKLMAGNRPSYTISLIPSKLKDKEEVIAKLSSMINIDEAEIKKLTDHKSHFYKFVKLKKDVGIGVISKIEENKDELPGVIYQAEPTRKYPFGKLAAHLLGYTGQIQEGSFPKFSQKDYLLGDAVGKAGLEKAYEEFLRGKRGVRYMQVNALGRRVKELKTKHPEPGFNLHLTIDLKLQRVAQRTLEGKIGSLVAMDPNTGGILAMVSKPGFSPNSFSGVLTPAIWNKLRKDPEKPLLNRAIQATYPPGSAIKPLAAIAGLETGVITENTKFDPCTGAFRFGIRNYRCWKEEGHGSLSLIQAIAQSCDVYFYQLMLKIGLKNWRKYVTEFGLGRRTGIDLPGEAKGLVPSENYYNRRYGEGKWTKGLLLNIVIGQGEVLVTPIQMARYIGAIATGYLVQPHLVERITSEEGKEIFSFHGKKEKVNVSSKTLEIIRKGLLEAVEGKKGTGRFAGVKGVKIAGKTGTAQNPHGKAHAWFIAYAPFQNPNIVVVAIIEEGEHGATGAAPLVQKVLNTYLKSKRVLNTPELTILKE